MKKLIVILLTFLMLSSLIGCNDDDETGWGTAQKEEMKITNINQLRLQVATPPPVIEKSLERENLKERLIRFNDENKVSYIYLLSDMGSVITFFPIRGKVSSVNSMLTTTEQIVTGGYSDNRWGVAISSPDLDGSYGSNGDAIFFFTTEGVYCEWNGKYFLCDRPLKLTTAPILIYDEE